MFNNVIIPIKYNEKRLRSSILDLVSMIRTLIAVVPVLGEPAGLSKTALCARTVAATEKRVLLLVVGRAYNYSRLRRCITPVVTTFGAVGPFSSWRRHSVPSEDRRERTCHVRSPSPPRPSLHCVIARQRLVESSCAWTVVFYRPVPSATPRRR